MSFHDRSQGFWQNEQRWLQTLQGVGQWAIQRLWPSKFAAFFSQKRQWWVVALLGGLLWVGLGTPTALAGLNDDRYDGNIFPLYAGNGSLVPPRVTLKESLKRDNPALLIFYVDDSQDCKQFVSTYSQLDAYYGRAANFIPVNVDSIPPQPSYLPTEAGYYYEGVVPQTVLLDQNHEVVLNAKGIVPYEEIDDALRDVFDLLPRSESVELRRRRAVNEINVEVVPD